MALTSITSFATIGLQSEKITVEVGASNGDHKFFIVGLGDTAVQESKQRVRMAVQNTGLRFPLTKVITVNLAPADIKKVGPRYDLPIALGILATCDLLDVPEGTFESMAVLGELALDGSLRHVSGVLSAAIACRKQGISTLVVPEVNAQEAALVPDLKIIPAKSLGHLIAILQGEEVAEDVVPPAAAETSSLAQLIDFADVRGQQHAKRALEIAAAGGHNVLLSGAPGSGKTLLAKAFRGILPPLQYEEAIEISQIYSVANLLPDDTPLLQHRPFRLVHHTASGVSIVGGGQMPRPGEISLAHGGVLFLDELAEFPSHVLEVLRQPLEDRTVTITRAQGSYTFPADFIMVAAMNPPQYSAGGERKIRSRISAPLLDRIDLTIQVDPVEIDDLQKEKSGDEETSIEILERVMRARKAQSKRLTLHGLRTNNEMNVQLIDQLCTLDEQSKTLLKTAAQKMSLSARGYHRTIKVARTIADLAGEHDIAASHVAEALQYRQEVDV